MNDLKTCSICYCSRDVTYSLEESIEPPGNLNLDGMFELTDALRKILKVNANEGSREICENCHNEFLRIYTFLAQCVKTEKLEIEIYLSDIKCELDAEVKFTDTLNRGIENNHAPTNFTFEDSNSSPTTGGNQSDAGSALFDENDYENNQSSLGNSSVDPLLLEDAQNESKRSGDTKRITRRHSLRATSTQKAIDYNENSDSKVTAARPQQQKSGKLKIRRTRETNKDKKVAKAKADISEKVEKIKEKSKIRKRRRGAASKVCEECGLNCIDSRTLRSHIMRSHATTEKNFICTQCPMQFRYEASLRAHEKKHTGAKYYCDQCAAEYISLTLLKEHQRTHKGTTFDCDLCDWKFIRFNDLKVHKRTHAEGTFSCDQCDVKFTHTKQLNAHKRIHSGEIYNCHQCPSKFFYLYLLRRHQEVHKLGGNSSMITITTASAGATTVDELNPSGNVQQTFDCDVCNAKYDSLVSLDVHKKTHILYACSKCPEKFMYKTDLTAHRKKMHLTTKLFCCTLCDAKFVKSMDFEAHRRFHSGDTLNCPECDAAFLRSDRLKEHMRIHTGETFDCELCGLKFTAMYILNRHMKILHCEGKPYACDQCGWKTRHKTVWFRHTQRHLTEKVQKPRKGKVEATVEMDSVE